MSNTIIPNSFQYPNYYSDVLEQYLTPEESKVLTRAIREIFGWEEHRITQSARISLSTFEHGNKRTGSAGVGLNRKTIMSALNTLGQYNILVKDGDATQYGQLYKLNLDENTIDIAGLKQRFADKQHDHKKRMKKIRRVSHTPAGGVSHTPAGGVSHTPAGGVSHTPTENHRKPTENHGNDPHQQQQTANDKIDVDGVVEQINIILSQWERNKPVLRTGKRRIGERINASCVNLIATRYHIESLEELVKCASILAPNPDIITVIGMMRGKNGTAAENTCWEHGKCALAENGNGKTLTQHNQPEHNQPVITPPIDWQAKLDALPDEDKARLRSQAEKKLGSHFAQMNDWAKEDTVRLVMLRMLQEQEPKRCSLHRHT